MNCPTLYGGYNLRERKAQQAILIRTMRAVAHLIELVLSRYDPLHASSSRPGWCRLDKRYEYVRRPPPFPHEPVIHQYPRYIPKLVRANLLRAVIRSLRAP